MDYDTVFGVDASLTGTGLACIKFGKGATEIDVVKLMTIKSKPPVHNYARINRYKGIVDEVRQQILATKPVGNCFVVIEGYAMMARGSAVTALPELGALLRNSFQEETVPWAEMTPGSVKKFGTGSGAAKKDLVLMSVYQRYGQMLAGTGLELKDSNQADAFVLALMGATYVRWKQHKIAPTKEHLEVFKGMDKERFWQLSCDSLI